MNLDFVDHARVEYPSLKDEVDMGFAEMSLEELLYFALVERAEAG